MSVSAAPDAPMLPAWHPWPHKTPFRCDECGGIFYPEGGSAAECPYCEEDE